MASEYAGRNKPVAERKALGEQLREEILAALPATVPELAAKIKRSRAAVLHHIGLMPDRAFIDTKTYPRTVRRKK